MLKIPVCFEKNAMTPPFLFDDSCKKKSRPYNSKGQNLLTITYKP